MTISIKGGGVLGTSGNWESLSECSGLFGDFEGIDVVLLSDTFFEHGACFWQAVRMVIPQENKHLFPDITAKIKGLPRTVGTYQEADFNHPVFNISHLYGFHSSVPERMGFEYPVKLLPHGIERCGMIQV